MKEQERRNSIRNRLASQQPVRDLDALPTGFAALDGALGGAGLPRGAIVELFGAPSSGKSTLALQIVSRLQRGGRAAAWIDADHSFDAGYAASLEVSLSEMPVLQPDDAEQAFEIGRQLCGTGAVDLLVIDSAAALVPRLELETGLAASGSGLQSRVLASGLRRLSRTAARSGTAILFLNQVRSHMQPGSGESESSAGGAALKLHAAVRIRLEAKNDKVYVRALKNKVGAVCGSGELELREGRGFMETP